VPDFRCAISSISEPVIIFYRTSYLYMLTIN